MHKNAALLAATAIIMALGIFVFFASPHQEGVQQPTQTPATFDPLNTTYTIDGQAVTLVNGKTMTPAPTTIFGQPVFGDLNGDGKADAAVMLVQDPGGSGTFYYIAAAIATADGTQGTPAILLGGRIAPQNVEIKNGDVITNYATRKPNQPMTAQPSVGVSRYFKYAASVDAVAN